MTREQSLVLVAPAPTRFSLLFPLKLHVASARSPCPSLRAARRVVTPSMSADTSRGLSGAGCYKMRYDPPILNAEALAECARLGGRSMFMVGLRLGASGGPGRFY